jgi:hypothetical protein
VVGKSGVEEIREEWSQLRCVRCAGGRPFVRAPVPEGAEPPDVKVVTVSVISRLGRELNRAATRRVKRSCLARGHVSGAVTAACKDVEGRCRVGQGDGWLQSPLAMERERRIVPLFGCRRDTATRPYHHKETLKLSSKGREGGRNIVGVVLVLSW